MRGLIRLGASIASVVAVVFLVAATPGVQADAAIGPHQQPKAAGLTSTCKKQLAAFVKASNAGKTTNNLLISFAPTAKLLNPTASTHKAALQKVTVRFVVHNANGAMVQPSAAAPVWLTIYGAPAGSLTTEPVGMGNSPLTVKITAASKMVLTYNGTFLGRGLTLIANSTMTTTNACTGTKNRALGSTTIPLAHAPIALGNATYSTPTGCRAGTSGTACAMANVDSDGLSLQAAVGYGAAVPGVTKVVTATHFARYTIDSGSIGTVLPLSQMGPDAIGPGPIAWKYYDSSGNEFLGFTYLAPVTLSMAGGTAQTTPILVLAVLSSACHPGKTCTGPPPFANFHYLGVGFDRGNTGGPFVSPSDNALLSVVAPKGRSLSPGYKLSGASVTVGVTSSNTKGFMTEKLTSSSKTPGDWLSAPICVGFPTDAVPAPTPICGSMLLDVGIPQMYVTFAPTTTVPSPIKNGLVAYQVISLASPSSQSPVLAYSFSSGPVPNGKEPPAIGIAPSKVDLGVAPAGASSGTNAIFINTGRHVLFHYTYLYDALHGTIGFQPLSPPLR